MIILNKRVATSLVITIIIVLAVVLVGGVLTYQYYWLPKEEVKKSETETPKDETISTTPFLEFSISECDSSIDPYSKPSEGIINQNWINNDTLLVEGFVKTFCGGAKIEGDFKINGNNLILEYKITIGESVTLCICAHKLVYKFLNINRQDYQISITEIE